MTRGHHVGLEQSPFQVYMMITQGLVHSSQDLWIRGSLCRAGTTVWCAMLSIQGWVVAGCEGSVTGSFSEACFGVSKEL